MAEFIISGLLSVVLIIASCLVVYEILRHIWVALPTLKIPHRMRILVVITGVFSAHIINVWMYGLAYFLLIHHTDLGTLIGPEIDSGKYLLDFWGCLYFSASTYSTLGFGDITPAGALRMVAGAEALNGIIVIGWTVSFTYLAMEKFWATSHHGKS